MDKLADILSTFFVTSQNYKPNKKDSGSLKKHKKSKSEKITHTDENHVDEKHVDEKHVDENHVDENHVDENHVDENHVDENHVDENHVDENHSILAEHHTDEHLEHHTDEHLEHHTDEHLEHHTDEHLEHHTDEHLEHHTDEHLEHHTDEHLEHHTDEHLEHHTDEHREHHTDEHKTSKNKFLDTSSSLSKSSSGSSDKSSSKSSSGSSSGSSDKSSSGSSSKSSSKSSSESSSKSSSESSSESSSGSSSGSSSKSSRNNTKSRNSIEKIREKIRQDIKENVSEQSLVKNLDDVMKKYILKPSEFYKKNMFIISDNVKTSIDILSDFLHKISMMKNADSIYSNSVNIISNVQNKKLYKQMLLENPYLYFTNFDVKNSLTKRKIDSLDNDSRTIFIFDNEMAHQYIEYIDILFSKNVHVFVLLDEEDKNIYDLYNLFESKLLIYKPSKNKMLQKRFYKNFIKKHFKDLLFDQYYNKVNNENIDIKYVILKNDELRYN